MKVSLKQIFSIVDGRLSTEMADVYKMLDFVFNKTHLTHQLPQSLEKLRQARPVWYVDAENKINEIKARNITSDFKEIMKIIDTSFKDVYFNITKINP